MKTKERIENDLQETVNLLRDPSLTQSQKNRINKKIQSIRQVIAYIESTPNEDYLKKRVVKT